MTDHAHTLLILTGEESRIMREFLTWHAQNMNPYADDGSRAVQCLIAFNRGITRGTEKIAAEFAERQRAKKK